MTALVNFLKRHQLWLIATVIVLQVSVLGYMAAKREWIKRSGQRIYLRTAPIDPMDPFRGEYVRLVYELNSMYENQVRDNATLLEQKGEVIYAALKEQGNEVYELDYFSDTPPETGVFLKGRTNNDWRLMRNSRMAAKFGIEQLYVEQGSGKRIEDTLGRRGDMQIPMEVKIAIGKDGTALIDDYRWSDLGIQTEVVRANRVDFQGNVTDNTLPRSPKIKLTIKNVSAHSVTLADDQNHCSFELTTVAWEEKYYPVADQTCAQQTFQAANLIQLQPEQTYSVEIDLDLPRWHIITDDGVKAIGHLPIGSRFRLTYHSPSPQKLVNPNPSIWVGKLQSSAFNGIGMID